MPQKKKSLASRLVAQDAREAPKPVVEVKSKPLSPKAPERSDRAGKTPVTGWFPQRVKLELEEIKIQRSRAEGRNVKLQDVLAEAYNDLFKKYGRAELAPGEE